jgi:hypothetical protein
MIDPEKDGVIVGLYHSLILYGDPGDPPVDRASMMGSSVIGARWVRIEEVRNLALQEGAEDFLRWAEALLGYPIYEGFNVFTGMHHPGVPTLGVHALGGPAPEEGWVTCLDCEAPIRERVRCLVCNFKWERRSETPTLAARLG